MTEAEWLACADPQRMLEFLRGKASDRKLRLFACECSRRLLGGLVTNFDEYLGWAELFADGEAGAEDLAAVGPEVAELRDEPAPGWFTGVARAVACAVRLPEADPFGVREATLEVFRYDRANRGDWEGQQREAFASQAALLRDLAGPLPFRPATVAPGWLAPPVADLARRIYVGRAFGRLPALADELRRAGCRDADVLGHCRGGGEHARGCWVVDLLLGRA
jgi:hypothetical protein